MQQDDRHLAIDWIERKLDELDPVMLPGLLDKATRIEIVRGDRGWDFAKMRLCQVGIKATGIFVTSTEPKRGCVEIVKVAAVRGGVTLVGCRPENDVQLDSIGAPQQQFMTKAFNAARTGSYYRFTVGNTASEWCIWDVSGKTMDLAIHGIRNVIDADVGIGHDKATMAVLASVKAGGYKIFEFDARSGRKIAEHTVLAGFSVTVCRNTGSIAYIDDGANLYVKFGRTSARVMHRPVEFTCCANGVNAVRFVNQSLVVGFHDGATREYNMRAGTRAFLEGGVDVHTPDMGIFAGVTTYDGGNLALFRIESADADTRWELVELRCADEHPDVVNF